MQLSKSEFLEALKGYPPQTQTALILARKPEKRNAKIVSVRLIDDDITDFETIQRETGLDATEMLKRGLKSFKLLRLLEAEASNIKIETKSGDTQDIIAVVRNIIGKTTTEDSKPEPT